MTLKVDEVVDKYVIKRTGRMFGVYSLVLDRFVLRGKTLFECQEYMLIVTAR